LNVMKTRNHKRERKFVLTSAIIASYAHA
jgi:hypothetical protein